MMVNHNQDNNWPLRAVIKVIQSGIATHQGMLELIQVCEDECPSPVWADLRSIDFGEGVTFLRNWLNRVLSRERPPENIRAYWFGIYNPSQGGKTNCDLYLSGSTRFDPTGKDMEWACWGSDSYIPTMKYANSAVLGRIYRAVQDREDGTFQENCHWKGLCSAKNGCWFGEYLLCLGFAGLAIQEICRTIWKPLIATASGRQAVTVGFDSGDLIILGSIDKYGWYPDDPG